MHRRLHSRAHRTSTAIDAWYSLVLVTRFLLLPDHTDVSESGLELFALCWLLRIGSAPLTARVYHILSLRGV